MNKAHRTSSTPWYARLLVPVAALVVTVTSALPARAETAPRVNLAEAVQTLPSAAELPPGNVTGLTATTVTKPTGLSPCNLAGAQRFNLRDNGAAIGIYSTPASTPVAQLSQWVVSTRVFASTAAAHDAISRLAIAEKSCPAIAKAKSMSFRRTWSARYATAAGWHGYHTVDIITVAGRATRLRHIAVYLQRGNALIQVDEIATVVGHNSAQQEARRLAVQKALAARVSAAAAT
ncbi:MAG: hypothetical protein QOI76_150 [Frankiales bacterium]|nr:hypothetical protein [Frankiales bacterium]